MAPATGLKLVDRSFVYLASQSPRRAQLLDQLGVNHRPLLADAQEDTESLEAEHHAEKPTDYVLRVTLAKLKAAQARHADRGLPAAAIVCADTTVAVGRSILGKPDDAAHVRAMLQRLSARTHRVCTAVAVAVPAAGQRWVVHQAVQVSRVHVAPISAQAMQVLIDSGEPFGKAGAYAIQGRFAAFIERIDGSHSGIMGLPLHETAHLLRKARVMF